MKKIMSFVSAVGFASLPLVYLPLTTDIYGVGKILWWLMLGLVLLFVWAVTLLATKKDEIRVNRFAPVLTALAVWSVVSCLRLPVGIREKMWLASGGTAVVAGTVAWYWVLMQAKKENKKILDWLMIPGVVAVLTSLVVFLVPDSKLPFIWPSDNPLVVIGKDWSLTGSLVGEILLLAAIAAWTVKKVLDKLKLGENYIKEAVFAGVLVLGLFLDGYKVTKLNWNVMDLNTSWKIAAETFKVSPLWGVGLGNYHEAFVLYRPASYNMTKLWANQQNIASMGALQMWTELGLVGLIILVLLVLKVLNTKNSFEKVLGGLMVLAWMLLPYNLVTWILLVTALVMMEEAKEMKLKLMMGESGFNAMPWVVGLLVLAGTGIMGYWGVREIVGEYYMKLSMMAAAKNDGSNTYEWQRKAVGILPSNADYRRVYSQTNLAIAKVLLSNKEISEADKEKVSVLLQQAVREAKAAIALDGRSAAHWLNLAAIYRDMIGLVDGAADWSAQAYQQSMALEPTNVITKLDYGGLLYAANRMEDADRVFEDAVVNKSDYANGWYNWAHTAKNLNKLYDAVQRLSQSLTLVPATSGDYETASKELEEWKKEYDTAVAKYQEEQKKAAEAQEAENKEKEAETFTTPEALPTKGAEEKVALPTGEMEPPKVSPTPEE